MPGGKDPSSGFLRHFLPGQGTPPALGHGGKDPYREHGGPEEERSPREGRLSPLEEHRQQRDPFFLRQIERSGLELPHIPVPAARSFREDYHHLSPVEPLRRLANQMDGVSYNFV